MPHVVCTNGEQTLLDIVPHLISDKMIASGSEFRRLIKQGGVSMNGVRVESADTPLATPEAVLKIGKKNFICFDTDRLS